MSTTPVIEVNHIYKSFADNHVLKDFSFEVRAGENVAILGKSGSGKSVLIKCIINLMAPEDGSIKVLGEVISDLDEEALDLAPLHGKVVLLNFWATWCGPCLEEMPHLERLQQAYPDDLVVVYVSDEAPDLLRAYLADRPMIGRHAFTDFNQLPRPYRVARQMRPVTLVYDRGGTVQARLLGAQTYVVFRLHVEALR